jgi:hypothetical protein
VLAEDAYLLQLLTIERLGKPEREEAEPDYGE